MMKIGARILYPDHQDITYRYGFYMNTFIFSLAVLSGYGSLWLLRI